jgi:hypothetical protein
MPRLLSNLPGCGGLVLRHNRGMIEYGTMRWAATTGGRLRGMARALQIVSAIRFQLVRRFQRRPQALGLGSAAELERLGESLVLPETPLVAQACALTVELGPPALANHAMRTWAWGACIALRDGLSYDRETLALAALLHDIALARRVPERACFAADGAAQADRELERWGAATSQRRAVADAICLHLRVDVPVRLGAEAHLVHAGAGLDLLGGAALRSLPPSARGAILAKYPRRDLKRYLVERLQQDAEEHPDSRIALWVSMGFLDRIRAASFEEHR